MKKALLITFLFSLFICCTSLAQDPGPMASNDSFKGRRELRKEMKIKRSSSRNAKKQERASIQKRKKQYGSKFGTQKKKKVKKSEPTPAPAPKPEEKTGG